MRKITCPHCQKSFTEADAAWDEATATGACPNPVCGKLLDPAAENGDKVIAQRDECAKSNTRLLRLDALAIVLLIMLAARFFGSFWLAGIGVLYLALAILCCSRDEGRDEHKGPTNLTRLSTDTSDELATETDVT